MNTKFHYSDYISVDFGDSTEVPQKFGLGSDYAPVSPFERSLWDRAQSIVWPSSNWHATEIENNPQCPYCGQQVSLHGEPDYLVRRGPLYGDQPFAGECQSCGWWFCQSFNYKNYEDYSTCNYYEGVLKAFDLDGIRWHANSYLLDLEQFGEDDVIESWQNLYQGNVISLGKAIDNDVEFFLVNRIAPLLIVRNRGENANFHPTDLVNFIFGAVSNEQNGTLYLATTSRFVPQRAERQYRNIRQIGIPIDIPDIKTFFRFFPTRPPTHKPWKHISGIRPPKLKGPHGPILPKYKW